MQFRVSYLKENLKTAVGTAQRAAKHNHENMNDTEQCEKVYNPQHMVV